MSSVKIAHFVPIRYQAWPPQATLVSDWLIFKILLLSELYPMIPLPTKMAAIAENRKFDKKKSSKIFSSETNLANWDQILVEWSLCGPLSESYPMTPPANQNIFLPFDTTGEFLNIFYMNYAFDLTQNIAKPNIYTCCSSSNICICCSLCGFYRVEYCIATSGLVVWLVGSF